MALQGVITAWPHSWCWEVTLQSGTVGWHCRHHHCVTLQVALQGGIEGWHCRVALQAALLSTACCWEHLALGGRAGMDAGSTKGTSCPLQHQGWGWGRPG